MYCNKCGHRNPDEARFCALCGTGLRADSDDTTISLAAEDLVEEEVHLPIEALRPDQGLLVIKRGMTAGSSFLLDKDVTTAGRTPDSDIFLDDVTVSRRHADVLRQDGRFIVKDAGSLNGTYVNRERVDVAELSSGDEVQIGRFKLVFHMGGGS